MDGRTIQFKKPRLLRLLGACDGKFCCGQIDQEDDIIDPPLFNGSRNLPEDLGNPLSEPQGKTLSKPTTMALEGLIGDLFRLHDLNMDGVLDETELIKLNEKIALLHYGKDADRAAVKAKFSELFRTELDPNGQSVDPQTFRRYMLKVLDGLDRNRTAQEMIMEQFIMEAKAGRAVFRCPSFQSTTDGPYLPTMISIDSVAGWQMDSAVRSAA